MLRSRLARPAAVYDGLETDGVMIGYASLGRDARAHSLRADPRVIHTALRVPNQAPSRARYLLAHYP